MDIKKTVESLWKRNVEKGISCVVKLAETIMDLFVSLIKSEFKYQEYTNAKLDSGFLFLEWTKFS